MLTFLKSWILNISAMSILILIFNIVIPSGKIKKNISLITGLILLISMVNPIIKFFSKDFNLFEFQLNDSNNINKIELKEKRKIIEKNRMEQVIKVYKERLTQDIELTLKDEFSSKNVKTEVEVNENVESDSLGEIVSIKIYVGEKKSQDEAKSVVNIEKIKVGNDDIKEKSDKEKQLVNVELADKITNKLNNIFRLSKEKICVVPYE